jgi:hypothetical protein
MSARIDALLADAHTAVVTLKATKTAAGEASLAAFVASALATAAAVKASKGGASRLAAMNKEAGVGYGSPAAVGFHAVTGTVLAMPEGDIDPERPFPSPTAIQTLVKKVGQERAKEILKGKRDQASVVYALQAAVEPDSVESILKAARKKVEDALVAFHAKGQPLDDAARQEASEIVAQIGALIDPDQAVIIPADASSLIDEDDLVNA